jgi:predicted glutamine amidotransferase
MCRVLAYLGPPLNVEHVLFTTDSSLVRQAYSPRMMASFLNLAGFGMVAWDPNSRMPEAPFVYRVTTLPVFDRNLENLARKIAPRCLLAHVSPVFSSGTGAGAACLT